MTIKDPRTKTALMSEMQRLSRKLWSATSPQSRSGKATCWVTEH